MSDEWEYEWIIKELRKIRLERNLTVKEMATKINVKEGTLACYETLQNEPKFSTVFRWAKALGYGVDLFLLERNREAAE